MALERYWDYAYSVSNQGNTRYHGPLERQAEGGAGTMSSGHHYGILSSGWDDKAYYEANTGYDHINMYDAASDSSGTYNYGQSGGYDGRIANATKDVIGYDPTIGANATLSRGKQYFTKWLSEADYKDQDTTGRTLQTYRSDDVDKRRKEKYDRIGGAVEVINFDQYMNDVGYAEAAQAMGIDNYETLDQVHNAMGYMQGTWQPPAEEVVEEEVQSDLQVLDGTESGQAGQVAGDSDGDGFVDAVVGVTDQAQQDTFDYQTAYNELVGNLSTQQTSFDTQLSDQQTSFNTQLSDALATQNTDFQTELANALAGQSDTYATDLANALAGQQTNFDSAFATQQAGFDSAFATQQAGFDTQLSTINTALTGYQDQVKTMQEEAMKAQESMRIQAAYGDPGRTTGASVTGVQAAGEEEQQQMLKNLGATGSFGRDGLRISSLNI